MFDNSGEKIKNVASIFCVIGIFLSIIIGLVLIVAGSNLNGDYYTQGSGTVHIWTGIITAAAGSLMSWVLSLLIAGFGTLISSQLHTEMLAHDILEKINSTSVMTGKASAPVKTEPGVQSNHKLYDTWKCANCKTENKDQAKFCVQCGQKHGEPWKCTNCKTSNASEHLFCSNCGMSRNASADLAEQRKECLQQGRIDYEALLKEAEQCANAKEIEQLFKNALEGAESEETAAILADLRKNRESERVYGNMKCDAINNIRKYLESLK